MFGLLAIALLLGFLYRWLNAKPDNYPPGPPTIPLLGSIPFIRTRNFHFFLEEIRAKYGPVIGLKLGPFLQGVAVCGPDEVVEVLKGEAYNGRLFIGFSERPGVAFANGQHWKDQRRFTLRHLRDFGFGTNYVSNLINEELNDLTSTFKGKKVLQGSGLFNISAINIIWAMVGGKRYSYDDPDFKILLHWLQEFFRQGNITGGINNFPTLKKFLSYFHTFFDDLVRKEINDFFQRSIDEHLATKTDVPRDLIDAYLDEIGKNDKKSSFTVETLKEVCTDLFAAGAESSSNTVSFAILYLLIHPEWQEKLFSEIDETLRGRTPQLEDGPRLPKVEAYLTEVQRCNTIAPISIPRVAVKDTTLNGYTIKKGTFIIISLWSILQDKKHWGDPENFRPERHLNEEGEFVKDAHLLFFGAGPRICLGENLARNFTFVVFVSLLQRYKFSIPEGEPKPSTICQPGFTTAPQSFNFVLEAR